MSKFPTLDSGGQEPPHLRPSIEATARLQSLLFFVFPIIYVIQNPGFEEYGAIESGIKPYHIFAVLLFLASAYRATIRSFAFFIIFVVICGGTTFINSMEEMNTRVLNAAGFAMTFLAAAGASPTDRQAARKGAFWACVLLAVTTLWQLPTIVSTAAENLEGRALYPTLMAGGVNIQASTFAILLMWAVGGAFFTIAGAISVVFLLSQTRAIFLVLPGLFINRLGRDGADRHKFRNVAISLIFISGFIIIAYLELIDLTKLLDRIYGVFSGDAGTTGRFLLYQVAISHSECYLTGCGLGSASELIARTNYAGMFEDNFHNIYVQMLIELGCLGVVFYITILASAYAGARSRLRDEGLSLAILATGIMGFVEFNGLEFLSAFIFGLGLSHAVPPNNYYSLRES